MAVFHVKLVFLLHLFWKKMLWDKQQGFVGQMSLLSFNQECQNIKWNVLLLYMDIQQIH